MLISVTDRHITVIAYLALYVVMHCKALSDYFMAINNHELVDSLSSYYI